MSSESKKDLRAGLNAIEKIEQFTAGISEKNFYANEEKISAVCMQFIALGERIYQLVKQDYFSKSPFGDRVNWKKIGSMRHILAHDYYDAVDPEILWATIKGSLPLTKEALEWHLKHEP